MSGYIVYNGFWNTDRPPAVVVGLARAAQQRGLVLKPLANTETTVETGCAGVAVNDLSGRDFALFWDKDVRLARAMESIGMRLYNSAQAVAVCDDKSATHMKLAEAGIPMPRTITAPMTFISMDKKPSEMFFNTVIRRLGFPMVVKECYGSLGGQVYLACDEQQLERLFAHVEAKPFICQQYIAASHGRDIRIYVVDGQPVAAMCRSSDTDFRANIGNGGRGEAYTPDAEQHRLAIACCEILELGFAGVDLLTDSDGRTLVCEVNASAQMAELERCTGIDVAGHIVEYVMRCEAIA